MPSALFWRWGAAPSASPHSTGCCEQLLNPHTTWVPGAPKQKRHTSRTVKLGTSPPTQLWPTCCQSSAFLDALPVISMSTLLRFACSLNFRITLLCQAIEHTPYHRTNRMSSDGQPAGVAPACGGGAEATCEPSEGPQAAPLHLKGEFQDVVKIGGSE